jgi:23S rRNA (uracil1939-C5)-methyltransferase
MNSDLIELTITDLAFGGEGVGRHGGQVVFVPFTAVGDRVQVRVIRRKKQFCHGEVVRVVEPSADRVAPPCPLYGRCGGCQYQHLSYEAEIRAKEKQLRDLLGRIGKFQDVPIGPVLVAEPYGYRNRITVHNEEGIVGFRATDGRTLVDVKECLLASPEVNKKLAQLREKFRPRPHYSIRADEVLGEAFYQTNRLLNRTLLDTVSAAVGSPRALLEGYAGVGFFTAALANRVRMGIAIESDPKACAEARRTLPGHIEVVEASVEEALAAAYDRLQGEDLVVLLDPTREGLSEVVRRDLLRMKAARMVYVSCHPATLSRDLKELAETWKIQSVQPIDLFPRTAHLETVTTLVPV